MPSKWRHTHWCRITR